MPDPTHANDHPAITAVPLIPPVPGGPGGLAAAAERAATFVENGARAAARSVANDGATLVGKDVAVGARIEAGVNVAADIASVVTLSPEDAVVERAGVFAIKEGIEHAPQVARGAEVAAEAAIEHAPEVGAKLESAFSAVKGELEKGGHAILEHSKRVIETKNTFYHVVEGARCDGERVLEKVFEATKAGKNFVLHAPELAEEQSDRLRRSVVGNDFKIKATLTHSVGALERTVKEFESGHIVEHVKQAYGHAKDGLDVLETAKKAYKIGTEAVAVAGTATLAVEHTPAGQWIEHRAEEAGHAVSEAGHAAKEAVTKAVLDIKHWTPDMSPQHLEQLLTRMHGGTPAPAPDQGHEPHPAPHAPDKGHEAQPAPHAHIGR